jgi:hypothetical protein
LSRERPSRFPSYYPEKERVDLERFFASLKANSQTPESLLGRLVRIKDNVQAESPAGLLLTCGHCFRVSQLNISREFALSEGTGIWVPVAALELVQSIIFCDLDHTLVHMDEKSSYTGGIPFNIEENFIVRILVSVFFFFVTVTQKLRNPTCLS